MNLKIISGRNLIIALVIAAGLASAGFFYFKKSATTTKDVVLTPQKAAEKVLGFINEKALEKGVTASLVNVNEEYGVYKMRIKIADQEFDSYVTKNGRLLFTQSLDLENLPESVKKDNTITIGDFSASKNEVCKEDGKPIVYFFGSESCPHCRWEHPIVEKVAGDFKDYISFHNNMDNQKDTEVFQKYSEGGIPALVFGCKYYRVGSGEKIGEKEEAKVLEALACKLTGNKPEEKCAQVQDLIGQIKD